MKLPLELELSVDSVKDEIGIHFQSFTYGYPIWQASLVKDAVCLKCMVLAPLSRIQWLWLCV